MQIRRSGAWAATWAGVVVVQLGCAGVIEPAGLADLMGVGSPVVLHRDLMEAEVQAAEALATRAEEGRFPREDARSCEELAQSFTWLGAYADDPSVVEAALWAMDECIDHIEAGDALEVAAYRLKGSPTPGITGAAIWVARAHVADAPVDHPVVQALVKVATEDRDMGTRIEALEALDQRAWGQEPAVAEAFYEALMAEWKPPLTAIALECLRYRGPGLSAHDRQRFLNALMVLASDLDPGIRGYAALALARIAPQEEDVRARILGLLTDRHPYTRSAAAEALADMQYLPAVHELVQGLDDAEPNVWRMLPYERPDGRKERLRFVGSRFERVDDAFLRALEEITSILAHPYRYRDVNLRYRDLDIMSAVRDARAWYAKHASAIPRRGVSDEAEAEPEPELPDASGDSGAQVEPEEER